MPPDDARLGELARQADAVIDQARAARDVQAERSATLRPHGPATRALGDQSYAHLGAMQAGPPEHLDAHLVRDHGVVPHPRGDGSWCRRVEQHARDHAVELRDAR